MSGKKKSKRLKMLTECMENAKSKKEELNCRRLHSNIFDPVSKKQQAKQDSAFKSYIQKGPSPKKKEK